MQRGSNKDFSTTSMGSCNSICCVPREVAVTHIISVMGVTHEMGGLGMVGGVLDSLTLTQCDGVGSDIRSIAYLHT